MLSSIKNFISNHKRLSIGIILYLAVFIVSGFISPWQVRDINFSDLELEDKGVIMDKIPLKIIYFGIYELIEMLVYVSEDGFSSNNLMFFIAFCALFSYTYMIRNYLIKNEFDSKAEEITIDFIYDNIFAYISAVIVYYLYSPIATKVKEIFDNGNALITALTVIIMIVFLIIPALPQFLQLFAYVYSILYMSKLLVYIGDTLQWNEIIEKILIFIVAVILLILINIIINFALDRMQEVLLTFLKGTFPVVFSIIIGAMKIFAIIIALLVILLLIQKFNLI